MPLVQLTNYIPQTQHYSYTLSNNPVTVEAIQESTSHPANNDPITVEAVQESLGEPETEVNN